MITRQIPVRFTIQPTPINEYISPAVRKFCLTLAHQTLLKEIRLNYHALAKIFYRCLLEAVKDDVTRREKYQSEISELLSSLTVEERELLEHILGSDIC